MKKILIDNISHTFFSNSASVDVVDHFSLTLNEGETVAILGPSGCGKSTILRCIAGLLSPRSGRVLINDTSPQTALKEKKIGFAFQDAALLEWATIQQNIMLPAKIGAHNMAEHLIISRVSELINLVGLNGFEKFYPSQISGGMKQRAALARALLLEPVLLLLDEPFGSLDLLTRSNLTVELSNILASNDFPSILVTHSIEEAVFLADKILILSPRPTKIIAEVEPNLRGQKTIDMYDSIEFATKVSECRKILLENWNK